MTKNSLALIRSDLNQFVGEKIKLKANSGRQRIIEKEGILEQTYPNLFVIKLNSEKQSQKRISFTYSDILTKTVELVICSQGAEKKFSCSQSKEA